MGGKIRKKKQDDVFVLGSECIGGSNLRILVHDFVGLRIVFLFPWWELHYPMVWWDGDIPVSDLTKRYSDFECGCVLDNNTGTEELYFANTPVLLSIPECHRWFRPKGCRKHFSLVIFSLTCPSNEGIQQQSWIWFHLWTLRFAKMTERLQMFGIM